MVIVDYSGTVISTLYASKLMDMFKLDNPEEPDINLVRHAILNTLRSYKKTFERRAGKEVIIAADGGRSWRKDYFNFYKSSREKNRKVSDLNWYKIFEVMNILLNEIQESLPFLTLKIPTLEADDIIAVLCKEYAKSFCSSYSSQTHSLFDDFQSSNTSSDVSIIVSEDRDFHQLQKYEGVEQFLPRKKSFFKDKDPHYSLMLKIINGDPGDGIPNILSDDDTFAEESKRQSVMTEKRLNQIIPWASKQIYYKDGLYDPSLALPNLNVVNGWCRNRRTIDLDFIPEDKAKLVLSEFSKQKQNKENTPNQTMDYFFTHKCKYLISDIQDFF